MAASLMNMLDDLEARLERTQAELQSLREENKQLKQQLERQNFSEPSVPSHERAATAEPSSEIAPENDATDQVTPEIEAPIQQELEQQTLEQPEPEAPAHQAPETEHNEQEAPAGVAETAQTNESAQAPSPHALLNQWYERYPKAFFKGHTKPLKVGIHQDLAEREEWPNKLIRRALANYVNLPRYIKAVRTGAERVDLYGQPAGKVDKEAALHASEKRGDQKENGQPKKAPSKPKPVASNPPKVAVEQAESEKSEPRKSLSLEDKLLGLQQKFKGR